MLHFEFYKTIVRARLRADPGKDAVHGPAEICTSRPLLCARAGQVCERARKSGMTYIAEPGGSIRDDHVIATADKYGMVLAFTGARLFHH